MRILSRESAALAAVAIGISIAVGFAVGSSWLVSWTSGGAVAAKWLSAVYCIFGGAVGLSMAGPANGRRREQVIGFLGGGMIAAVLVASAYMIALDLPTEELYTVGAQEPSWGSQFAFLLFGAAASARALLGRVVLSVQIVQAGALLGISAIIGHLIDLPALYFQFGWSTAMARPTAVAIVLIALSVNSTVKRPEAAFTTRDDLR